MQHFPSITEEEFNQACQVFYDRARRASDSYAWRQVTYDSACLCIKKEYLVNRSCLANTPTECADIGQDELTDDEDNEVVNKPYRHLDKDTILIEFSILRSATYQVPVLWFMFKHVPPGFARNIDTVYQNLVPEATRQGLRGVGVMGGISIANHPVTDLSAFFIHPCNTSEALEEICQNRACLPEEYLVIWLGLVGPSVNLYIPSQLLLANNNDKN